MTTATFPCRPGSEARVTLAWLAARPLIAKHKILVGMLKNSVRAFRVARHPGQDDFIFTLLVDNEITQMAFGQYERVLRDAITEGYQDQLKVKVGTFSVEVHP